MEKTGKVENAVVDGGAEKNGVAAEERVEREGTDADAGANERGGLMDIFRGQEHVW